MIASNVLTQEKQLVKFAIRLSVSKSDCVTTSQRCFSTNKKNEQQQAQQQPRNPLLVPEFTKKGTGGRSAFSGRVATVFGGNGVVGRILVNRLGKEGSNVVIPSHTDEMYLRPLKLCGDLGQIIFLPLNLRDETTIRNAVKKSNLVINCIGRDWETSNWSFEDLNIEAARKIAKISRECGVEKLIHFSALNASPNPERIYLKNGSRFLKTKYEGEEAVKSEFPNAVIIRPAEIYGENDRFLYYYSHFFRRFINTIPLWNKGEKTIKMPIHQSDVANGVMKIVRDHDIYGQTFDFVGEHRYLLSDIVDFIMAILRRNDVKRTYMSPMFLATVWLTEKFPKRKMYNFDFLEREFISDTVTFGNPNLKDLGIKQVDFGDKATWHLKPYNRLSFYDERLGEFPDPDPPQPLPDDYELQHRF